MVSNIMAGPGLVMILGTFQVSSVRVSSAWVVIILCDELIVKSHVL